MALTVATTRFTGGGNQRGWVGTIAFDSSYPTGGEPLTPGDLSLKEVEELTATPQGGYVFEYDYTNEKLQAFYADYDAVADGALIEVADTTDLSSVTGVRVAARGW